MKILLFIILYLIIGFIFTVLITRESMKVSGYNYDTFFDLDEDEQSMVIFVFLLWPLALIIVAIFIVLNLVIFTANIGHKEDDDAETSEKRGS